MSNPKNIMPFEDFLKRLHQPERAWHIEGDRENFAKANTYIHEEGNTVEDRIKAAYLLKSNLSGKTKPLEEFTEEDMKAINYCECVMTI